jgi:hypothetical protein
VWGGSTSQFREDVLENLLADLERVGWLAPRDLEKYLKLLFVQLVD